MAPETGEQAVEADGLPVADPGTEHRAVRTSMDGSSISAGGALGPTGLHPHRLSRHLRRARNLSAVHGGVTARWRGSVGRRLSGEFLRPHSCTRKHRPWHHDRRGRHPRCLRHDARRGEHRPTRRRPHRRCRSPRRWGPSAARWAKGPCSRSSSRPAATFRSLESVGQERQPRPSGRRSRLARPGVTRSARSPARSSAPSTISREITRNRGRRKYRAIDADDRAIPASEAGPWRRRMSIW